ncbi:MAG: hypothetical protein M3N08_08060 [Pseudomonadota bacterium]|nr:hypothetical protein [Pseudomonadota bacterium]
MRSERFPPDAGLAIGAILFVIALLALLGTIIAAGGSDFGTASISDRIAADVATQANLIRSKIIECNLIHGTNSNYDGYPSSDPTNGTLVSALNCSGDPSGQQSLWSGSRTALLPPPTMGFGAWHYINTNASGLGSTAVGGRCIWIQPTTPNASSVSGIVNGLTKAASKFSNAAVYDSASEAIYDPSSASQKFVVWITMPTGTPNSNCLP